ncbi:membrane protein [Pokkaliibacter plantistimulans]|uniref:Membrane protein n=1 Tax=Pokkaliibacter plantistimulans TaxID=1635171 RepID=A0ABX5LUJ2_9GAMM|nr:hypothetical protein [Pokkaliibacter plantistimulans]PXF29819.1 membrane protein [Pokkaliibacter plantistimulans]
MKNTKNKKLAWLVAVLFSLSVASLITLEGVERSDWFYAAALPAVIAALWMQYRNLFASSKDA